MWYFAIWHGTNGWIGLAKQEPFINGHPLYEPGDVWFELGATAQEAFASIKDEIARLEATKH